MLGVLAVVGTVAGAWGGQWIAARRDDRRWERDTAREDLRWERERERLRDERAHDVLMRWRESRATAYSATFAAFSAWDSVLKAQQVGTIPDDPEYADKYQYVAFDALAELSVYASAQVLDQSRKTMAHLAAIKATWLTEKQPSFGEIAGNAHREMLNLLNSMRSDLGVDPLGEAYFPAMPEAAIPIPPSAPTS